MDCPRCHANLTVKNYAQFSIYSCDKCGGLWMSSDQLNQLIHHPEHPFSSADIESTLKKAHAGLTIAEDNETIACPTCATKMTPVNYDYSSGVIIHFCPQGHGVWLDKGELESAEIYVEHWDEEEIVHKDKFLDVLRKDENVGEMEKKLEELQDKQSMAKPLSKISLNGLINSTLNLFQILSEK